MNVLVIGYGSIGKRHVRILQELGLNVAICSGHPDGQVPAYSDLETALLYWRPFYVVVANRTSDHLRVLSTLQQCQYQGKLLVEKPLAEHSRPLPLTQFPHFFVGYNLRFHPLLQKLKQKIDTSSAVINATVYVGSYLPDWRPRSDYRISYSAKKNQGGGVLRDLSHELDYIYWLFGPWTSLTALGGKYSPLEIDSDDAFSVLMTTKRCRLISLHLNYLDRDPRREMIVNTADHTYRLDFIAHSLTIDKQKITTFFEHDDTYRNQHQAVLEGQVGILCEAEVGMTTLKTIEAIEKSAATRTWITQ